jgi:hypothetical protein
MLGQHPDLYGFPELVLFTGETLEETLRAQPNEAREVYDFHHAGLKRAVAELEFGSQSDATIRLAQEWIDERATRTGAEIFDSLLNRIAPRRGVEKSPDTARDLHSLIRVARHYPRARFIHLTRSPDTAIRSIARHLGRMYMAGRENAHTALAASTWASMHENICAFQSVLPATALLRLRGEDLLSSPRPHCVELARWLGLRADDDAIDGMLHPENSVYANLGPKSARGGNDWLFLSDPTLHRLSTDPSQVIQFDSWLLPGELRERVSLLATHFGYL